MKELIEAVLKFSPEEFKGDKEPTTKDATAVAERILLARGMIADVKPHRGENDERMTYRSWETPDGELLAEVTHSSLPEARALSAREALDTLREMKTPKKRRKRKSSAPPAPKKKTPTGRKTPPKKKRVNPSA